MHLRSDTFPFDIPKSTLYPAYRQPFRRNEFRCAAPFFRQCHSRYIAPNIRPCVVQNNDLEAPVGSDNLAAKRFKNGTYRCNILVSRSTGCRWRVRNFESARKINLARLIINQKPWNGMQWLFKEEALESQRHNDVVGKPVGTTADFPKKITTVGMYHPNC